MNDAPPGLRRELLGSIALMLLGAAIGVLMGGIALAVGWILFVATLAATCFGFVGFVALASRSPEQRR